VPPVTAEPSWCLYLLRCGDGSLYCGITNAIEKRFAAHQAGKGARYTRGRGPLRIVYQEVCEDRGAALRREHAVKRLPRNEKLALIRSARKKRPQRAAIDTRGPPPVGPRARKAV
jgi:predicted GIY-YIG superfamily endonuclease